MNPQDTKKLITSTIHDTLNSYSNFIVPQHKHNGVDSLRIPIENIIIRPGVGVTFANAANMYNLYIDNVDSNLELIPNIAVKNAGNANFNIGEVGTPFNNVNIATDTGIQFSIVDASPGLGTNVFTYSSTITNDALSDGVNSVTEQLFPTGKRFTASGDFAIQWPNAPLPTAVAGMLAFSSGTMYMALTNGSWTAIPTVGGLGGTVTSVALNTANGFSGTVATATTTPTITITTTVTGIVKGNGTAISAASAGTDYVAPGSITSDGITMNTARLLGRTTAGSGAVEEISVGTGLSLSAGTLTASSTGFTWAVITADQTAVINNGYIANKGTLLTLALPTTCAAGSVIGIAGMNAGLWKISQSVGQQIHFGNTSTTSGAGGSLASTLTYDGVTIVCSVANTEFVVIYSVGNISIT